MPERPQDNRLPREGRLPAALYPGVFDLKKSFPGRYVVLHLGQGSDSPRPQLGISTSRRTLPTAVARNRARRLMREAFRTRQHTLLPGARIVLVARRRMMEDGTLETVSRDFNILCQRAGILNSLIKPGLQD